VERESGCRKKKRELLRGWRERVGVSLFVFVKEEGQDLRHEMIFGFF
jgi:hypothetical protein